MITDDASGCVGGDGSGVGFGVWGLWFMVKVEGLASMDCFLGFRAWALELRESLILKFGHKGEYFGVRGSEVNIWLNEQVVKFVESWVFLGQPKQKSEQDL